MDIIYRVHIDPMLLMHFTDPYSIPSLFRIWENTQVKSEQQSNISSSFSQGSSTVIQCYFTTILQLKTNPNPKELAEHLI